MTSGLGWFDAEDMKIGAKIRDVIEEAIRLRDKVLLVLSEASIASRRFGTAPSLPNISRIWPESPHSRPVWVRILDTGKGRR